MNYWVNLFLRIISLWVWISGGPVTTVTKIIKKVSKYDCKVEQVFIIVSSHVQRRPIQVKIFESYTFQKWLELLITPITYRGRNNTEVFRNQKGKLLDQRTSNMRRDLRQQQEALKIDS